MTLAQTLGIQQISITTHQVILQLPISDKIFQPYGFVHGGINALLAEEAASLGANAVLKATGRTTEVAVGVDITTNHLQAATHGLLEVRATPLQISYRLQTWQIDIREVESGRKTALATMHLTSHNKKV